MYKTTYRPKGKRLGKTHVLETLVKIGLCCGDGRDFTQPFLSRSSSFCSRVLNEFLRVQSGSIARPLCQSNSQEVNQPRDILNMSVKGTDDVSLSKLPTFVPKRGLELYLANATGLNIQKQHINNMLNNCLPTLNCDIFLSLKSKQRQYNNIR